VTEETKRDGFEVVRIEDGEVIHFVPCDKNHPRERERVLREMLINADTDRYFIRDTRDD